VKIIFIRHGLTSGNLEKRYIGRTDEPLCAEGVKRLKSVLVPACGRVYSSPMKRCLQTAAILFPDKTIEVINDLRECDFGDFENKTAGEMSEDKAYRAWVGANCETPIPNGENVTAFKARVCASFLSAGLSGTTAFILHGGCVMAILERFAAPKRGFYEWHINNGEFILCDYENGVITCS
jgi:alpha-ribazole phosphatase